MAEVAVSSDNISVLGGPSSITLNLDTGPAGQRGSYILYGFANPNTPEAQETFIAPLQVFDFYIVVDPGSEDYLQLYQYINQDGEFLWVPAVKLAINQYSTTRPTLFVAGQATIELNIADLGLAGVNQTGAAQSVDAVNFFSQPGTAAYFNTQISISNFNPEIILNSEADPEIYPVVFTYTISDVELDQNDNQLKLPITIVAGEVTQLGIVPVNDKYLFVQILATLQSPDYILDFFTNLSPGGS
jgi:hypothetical protein